MHMQHTCPMTSKWHQMWTLATFSFISIAWINSAENIAIFDYNLDIRPHLMVMNFLRFQKYIFDCFKKQPRTYKQNVHLIINQSQRSNETRDPKIYEKHSPVIFPDYLLVTLFFLLFSSSFTLISRCETSDMGQHFKN